MRLGIGRGDVEERSAWRLAAFVVPALLLAASAIVAHRLFRNPYERPY